MKKAFFMILSFLLFLSVNAQEWIGVGKRSSSKKIQETLVSSSENKIVVDVKLDGFYKTSVKTQQGEQLIISGEGMAYMPIKGAPNLPMYPISMIIGDMAEMEVSVVKSEYVDFKDIEVAPSKGNFSRQINPDDVPYTYGEMYQQDAFYPAQQAVLGNPYILRDYRGQNVMVYPYAYNPVTKTLRVYTYLRIEARKISDDGINPKVNRKRNNVVDSEINASYKRRFINYPTKERYTFMSAQKQDMDETKAKLQKIISELNGVMREQFMQQFKLIRENFKEVFTELFGGGKADIVLDETQDVLECGIEIQVQPPGKKLQNMMLLSGGERALTAIALLFGILKMHPSPFCLLDEIEAALDDANVYRLSDYLKKIKEEIQFIMITHRKGTMENACSLYGVTMEEKGISKVISLKMNE